MDSTCAVEKIRLTGMYICEKMTVYKQACFGHGVLSRLVAAHIFTSRVVIEGFLLHNAHHKDLLYLPVSSISKIRYNIYILFLMPNEEVLHYMAKYYTILERKLCY